MNRPDFKVIVTAGVTISALLAQPPGAGAETTFRQILSGEAGRNIIEFTVPKDAISSLEKKGFHISKYDTRNVVSRFSDPTFLNCTNNAGLIPIAQFGPAIAGQALGIPVNPLVGPSLNTALSAAGVKSYQQCENDWLQRISDATTKYKFEVIDAALGRIDSLDSNMVGDVLNLQNRTHTLGVRIGRNEMRVKNLQEALDKQGKAAIAAFSDLTRQARDNKKKLDQIADQEQKAQQELQLRKELQQKRDLVQGSAAALSLITKLAFRNDPVAVERIDTGISSVARISDSIVQLSSGLDITTGAKLLLSANIAGGALSLISMFGPHNNETAVLQQQLSAIRGDIADLRQDMDQRFDRMQNMLVQMTQYLDTRLANIDQRLENIEGNMQQVGATLDALYSISRESFNFLIASQFEQSVRACGRPLSKGDFPSKEARECAENASLYARQGASLYAISSGSLYDLKAPLDVGASTGASLPSLEQVGYLDAVLRQASKNHQLKNNYDLPASDLVSPSDWATAVDNFASIVADPGQFKSLKQDGVTRAKMVQNYKEDITDIIKVGEKAKSGIATIRKAGVDFGLDLLTQKIAALNDIALDIIQKEMTANDLAILEVQLPPELQGKLRSPDNHGGFRSDGTTLYSILYVATDYFYVTAGPQKGAQWKPAKRATLFKPVNALMPQYQEGTVEAQETAYLTANYDKIRPGFQVQEEHSVLEYSSDLAAVNQTYLAAVPVGELSGAAKDVLDDIYQRIQPWALQDPTSSHTPARMRAAAAAAAKAQPAPAGIGAAVHQVADTIRQIQPARGGAIIIPSAEDENSGRQKLHAACDDVANMRKVVAAYAELARTSYTEQDAAWREALSRIPETSFDLCSLLLKAPRKTDYESQKAPLKDFVSGTIKEALSPRIEKLRVEFAKVDQSSGMDIIDARLRGLRSFVSAQAQAN